MKVKLWDGKTFPAKDRDEAVAIVKRELKGWMQDGDRLAWTFSRDGLEGEKPDAAYVVNEDGEWTDAHAVIVQ